MPNSCGLPADRKKDIGNAHCVAKDGRPLMAWPKVGNDKRYIICRRPTMLSLKLVNQNEDLESINIPL